MKQTENSQTAHMNQRVQKRVERVFGKQYNANSILHVIKSFLFLLVLHMVLAATIHFTPQLWKVAWPAYGLILLFWFVWSLEQDHEIVNEKIK